MDEYRNCKADQVSHDPVSLPFFPARPSQFFTVLQEQQKMNKAQVSSVFNNLFILQWIL